MARIYADAQATNATTNEQATTTKDTTTQATDKKAKTEKAEQLDVTTGERFTFDKTTRILTVKGVKYKKDKSAEQYKLDLTIDLSQATDADIFAKAVRSMVIDFQNALRTKTPELLQSLNGKNYRTTFKTLTTIYDPQKLLSETLATFGALTPEQQALLMQQLQQQMK